MSASNGVGPDATQAFTLTVNQAPTITGAANSTVTAGQPLSFSLQATGFPAPSLTAAGTLPTGVSFTDNGNSTASLAGSPYQSGTYPLRFAAMNSQGSTAQASRSPSPWPDFRRRRLHQFPADGRRRGHLSETALTALVTDAYGNAVPGVTVTFTAPSSGPSGTFADNTTSTTAVTGSTGWRPPPPSRPTPPLARSTVTATATGVSTPADFSLTNTKPPTNVTVTSPATVPAGSMYAPRR